MSAHQMNSNETTASILIVEDDSQLNEQLSDLLSKNLYSVDRAFDGEIGLTAALANSYDLIVLDVMMPNLDGFSLLKELRKTSLTPVLMLTAKGAEEERIMGFHQGADDYLTKPFNSTELLLRIEAILRRTKNDAQTEFVSELQLDNIVLRKTDGVAFVAGEPIELTPIQFRLLWTLMFHRGEVLSKAFLYQTVLHRSLGPHDRSLDMHLSRVRRKLIAANGPRECLKTVHGEGYCIS